MEIEVAKTAGFCFGVNRAVELTYGLLAEGRRVATLGPLIHNPQAVADMQAKGAFVADSVPQVPDGYEVVIRSHGVPRSVYDELEARGIAYHDATCPFVQKIQRIAAQAEKEGAVLLVAGDKTHPEVQGIVGHTRGEVFVFANLEELAAWKGPSDPQKPLFAVAQTTFQVTKWKESSEFLKKAYTNARIFDTICNATWATIYERLIKAGCDVNERFFESKQSPLHLVCTKEKPAERLIPIIELLINAGADPNQPDVDGLTPLMACNSPEIAVCLMNHGANPSLRNDDGQTAYDFHMKNGYPPIAEAIKHWQSKQKKGEAR